MRRLPLGLLSRWMAGAAAAAILSAMAAFASDTQSSKPRSLTILYTSQVRSQIRSCNCTKFRFGGYGREATLVNKMRNETKNVILVDGGDFAGAPGLDDEKLKVEVALKSIRQIGYTAMVPGEAEVCFGDGLLGKLSDSTGVPVVLANVLDEKADKSAVGKQYMIHTTSDGLRVAILGLLELNELLSFCGEPPPETNLRSSDPAKALKELLPAARKEADFVLVLAHTRLGTAKELAKTDGVDVVLCVHPTKMRGMAPPKGRNIVDAPAETIGNCVLVESNTQQGWNIGRLDIELGDGAAKSFTNRLFYLNDAYEENPEIVKIYDIYEARLRELAKRKNDDIKARVKEMLKQRGYDPSKSGKADETSKPSPEEKPADAGGQATTQD